MKCVFWPGQIRVFFQEAEREWGELWDGGGPGEVNISAKPRNKTETTCPPSGDR